MAAVGPATAAALAARRLVADLVPGDATAAGLVAAMPPAPTPATGGPGGRVLFPARRTAAT